MNNNNNNYIKPLKQVSSRFGSWQLFPLRVANRKTFVAGHLSRQIRLPEEKVNLFLMGENFFGVLTEWYQKWTWVAPPPPPHRLSTDPLTGNNIVDVSVPRITPYKEI